MQECERGGPIVGDREVAGEPRGVQQAADVGARTEQDDAATLRLGATLQVDQDSDICAGEDVELSEIDGDTRPCAGPDRIIEGFAPIVLRRDEVLGGIEVEDQQALVIGRAGRVVVALRRAHVR